MNQYTYAAGFWLGKHIVLPFLNGVYDATVEELLPRFELSETLSEVTPDWVEKLLNDCVDKFKVRF